MALSTVGGWLACRGAGQLSNRYGKAFFLLHFGFRKSRIQIYIGDNIKNLLEIFS